METVNARTHAKTYRYYRRIPFQLHALRIGYLRWSTPADNLPALLFRQDPREMRMNNYEYKTPLYLYTQYNVRCT